MSVLINVVRSTVIQVLAANSTQIQNVVQSQSQSQNHIIWRKSKSMPGPDFVENKLLETSVATVLRSTSQMFITVTINNTSQKLIKRQKSVYYIRRF